MKTCFFVFILMLFNSAVFAAGSIDTTPRIAIICAFEPEIPELKKSLTHVQRHVIHRTEFITGNIGDKKVVLFLSGMSMVNAAMTTQMAADHFNLKSIVFSGIAGGVNPELNIGDVVVPTQWGQYLESIMAREKDGKLQPPTFFKTPYANFGMMFPQDVQIANAGKKPEEKFWFSVDQHLFQQAQKILNKTTLNACTPEKHCLTHSPKVVFGGNGVSGATFMDNALLRQFVFNTFQANVVDMESASIAHVAYVNHIPFIVFRSLSDLAGGGTGENEEGTFFSLAAQNSAQLVIRYVRELQ